MKIQIPKELCGDKSNMHDAFIKCAAEHDDSSDYAIELLKLLPQKLKSALVFFEKLTKLWRYYYGKPFDRMPGNTIISGTNMYFSVLELYKSIRIANKNLTKKQLYEYLDRLSIIEKHYDVLFEMRPMKDVKKTLKATYEISRKGIGNTTCDWQVTYNFTNIIFDVKNRIKSLIKHMEHIIPALNKSTATIQPTAPNPEDLFKSVETKFKERCYLFQLQGVWIHTEIKEHEEKLIDYFKKKLNKKKVHFVIISDWENDAFILARNKLIKFILKRVFCLLES